MSEVLWPFTQAESGRVYFCFQKLHVGDLYSVKSDTPLHIIVVRLTIESSECLNDALMPPCRSPGCPGELHVAVTLSLLVPSSTTQ